MTRRVRIFRVDAFTTTACAGNPACVVLGGDGLEERALQAITREQGGVDVAFVLPPDAADHDLRLRFFTPHAEASFVGHASLAVHAVRDALHLPACHRQKQRSGIVEIARLDSPHGRQYSFSQAPPPLHGPPATDWLMAALDALGIDLGELDPGCPSVVAGVGGSRALLAVRSGTTLARLRPDMPRLTELSSGGKPAGYFVYSLAPTLADCDSEARMFCPALGIMEDPVSGNAHAMLAAQLQALGRLPLRVGYAGFTGRQGHHMGRPGALTVHFANNAKGVQQVCVAGSARVVFDATLEL